MPLTYLFKPQIPVSNTSYYFCYSLYLLEWTGSQEIVLMIFSLRQEQENRIILDEWMMMSTWYIHTVACYSSTKGISGQLIHQEIVMLKWPRFTKTNTACSLIHRPLILMHVGMKGDISDKTRKGTMRRIKEMCEGIWDGQQHQYNMKRLGHHWGWRGQKVVTRGLLLVTG